MGTIRYSKILLTLGVLLLITINIYQYYIAQQNKNFYLENEKSYINVVNKTTEALLKDEVNITDQERLQFEGWKIMFEKYGVSDSDGNVQILQIPNETIEVLELFPENSKPVLMVSSDKYIEVRYSIGSKTYGLILNKFNNIFVKTIYISTSEPEYLVGYRNINNHEYSTVFVDLYPQN